MRTWRVVPALLLPVLVACAVLLAACGSSSSGSSSSPGASGPASGSVAAGGGSAKQFCDTFASAHQRLSDTAASPTPADVQQLRQFADDIEKTAPSDLKSDASALAGWLRYLADVAGRGSGSTPAPSSAASELSALAPALAHIGVWAATHCTGLSSAAASLASQAQDVVSQGQSLASEVRSLASTLPSALVSALPSALQSLIASPAAS